jgi:hypothetical protein
MRFTSSGLFPYSAIWFTMALPTTMAICSAFSAWKHWLPKPAEAA